MHTTSLEEPKKVDRKFRLFTLYGDFAAGIRAKRLAGQIARLTGIGWQHCLEMWKLDSIGAIVPIREMIAREAAEADVLLIAVTSRDQPEPGVIRWLDSLSALQANRSVPGLLVGLLGEHEQPPAVEPEFERFDFVRELQQYARRSGMDFVWRPIDRDGTDDCDWLAGNFRRLIARKESVPNTAIVQ